MLGDLLTLSLELHFVFDPFLAHSLFFLCMLDLLEVHARVIWFYWSPTLLPDVSRVGYTGLARLERPLSPCLHALRVRHQVLLVFIRADACHTEACTVLLAAPQIRHDIKGFVRKLALAA